MDHGCMAMIVVPSIVGGTTFTVPANRKLLDDSFKVYATRKLREENLLSREVKPWSRHGSTPYLWTEEQLQRAIDYVINGQGDEPLF